MSAPNSTTRSATSRPSTPVGSRGRRQARVLSTQAHQGRPTRLRRAAQDRTSTDTTLVRAPTMAARPSPITPVWCSTASPDWSIRVDRPHRSHRPDADLRGATPAQRACSLLGALQHAAAASGTCAGRLPCMPRTTTRGDRIERYSCVRRVRKRLFPGRFTAESGVDLSSAA